MDDPNHDKKYEALQQAIALMTAQHTDPGGDMSARVWAETAKELGQTAMVAGLMNLSAILLRRVESLTGVPPLNTLQDIANRYRPPQ